MRFASPLLLLLAACKPSSPPTPPSTTPPASVQVVRGKVNVPGARATGTAGFLHGRTYEEVHLAPVKSGPDGRFELPLPERFVREAAARTTWSWWVRLHAEHDEFQTGSVLYATSWTQLEDVNLTVIEVSPEGVEGVRARLESLRSSPLKKLFRFGLDPVDGYGEAREVFEELEEAAGASRRVREVLRKYLTDADDNLRALAYEVLTLSGECPDAPPEPPDPKNPEQARALIDWVFRTIRDAKHGGHLAVGVDLDDQCTRCYGLFSDLERGLWGLTRQEAHEALKKYEAQAGQVRVFRTLALEELRRTRTRDDREKEEAKPAPMPDAPLPARPDLSEDWIAVRRYPGILLARPESDAVPLAILPEWLGLEEVAWSPDGKKLVGRGGPSSITQVDLWVVDLEKGVASRAAWGARDWRPQWFPDGRRILFPRNAAKGQDLWVLEVEGFKASRLREIGRWVDHLDLDPSGTKLAYATRDDGPTGLHVLDLGTGRVETVSEGRVIYPVWSSDGKRIAFIRNDRLCLADVPGGSPREIPVTDDRIVGLARSPDGRLALTSHAGPFNQAREGRLWVLEADGGEARTVAKMAGSVALFDRPDWSPDGRRIAFVALEGPKEKPTLYVASDDGRTLVRVLDGAEHPRWRTGKR